jgi:hypothetical protein
MLPHNGNVGVRPTKSGKGCGYALVQPGKAFFSEDKYTLMTRFLGEPRDNEVLQVAAGAKKRLVVVKTED